MDSSRDFDSAVATALQVLTLTAVWTLNPERSDRRLPHVSSTLAASSRSVIARLDGSHRLGGLCGSVPSSNSPFLSVSEYPSHFRDCLGGQRLAAIPSVSSFRGRSRPTAVNLETPVSAWRKCCRALSARGDGMNPLDHGAASTDMQLCCSFCELSSPCRSAALLLAVRSGSAALSQRLLLIALFDP